MAAYSVKKLAKLAGVSVRTLHLYDQMGLLKPSLRTEARYRMYGEKELLRLQQILFYRELDMPLKEIGALLDNVEFNLVKALEGHKMALISRQQRIKTMLETIDKTIGHLKHEKTMSSHEELYEGFSKEQGEAYRNEATKKWGAEAVEKSENSLQKSEKAHFEQLKEEQKHIAVALFSMMNQDPTSPKVQAQIARHYENIRKFWGTHGSAEKQAEAYAGLGQLYVDDERYTQVNGQSQPAYASFLSKAMKHFSEIQLK
jgi:DNA-binding transcriptional MerR regulator